MLDVAHSFHSLRFIEKYVIVFVLFCFFISIFVFSHSFTVTYKSTMLDSYLSRFHKIYLFFCNFSNVLSRLNQLLSWLTIMPCLRCLDDFHDCHDSLTLYVLDVAHSFHSLRFIEKYVIVFVFVCFSLMSLDLFLLSFFFLILPRREKG